MALRLWHLGARSIWTDEGSTWTAAAAPLPELIRLCAAKDASPPLFYLLTSLAIKLGENEVELRLVSLLASLGLVWLTYRIARLFAGRPEATLAAAITALSPYQLMFGQEARTYALVAFLAVGSFYLFLRAVLLDRRRAWLPYVIVTTLALYTQSIAVLSLAVQGAIVIFTASGRRRMLPWTLSQVACVALYLPWLFVTLSQMSRLSESHWYLGPPGEHGVFQVLRAVFLSPVPLVTAPPRAAVPGLDAWLPSRAAQLVVALVPALPLLAAAPSAFRRGPRERLVRSMAAALLLPLLAVLAASSWVPLWLPRYFVFLTPFLAALLARGLASLRPRGLRQVWGALVLLVEAYGCMRYDLDYTKEQWRATVHTIWKVSVRGRSAVLVPFDIDPFRFYNVKLEHPIPAFEVSHPEVPFASHYTERQITEMLHMAAARTAPYDEVWVVVRSPNSPVRQEIARRSERVAATGRRLIGRWRWDASGGPLTAARYGRADDRPGSAWSSRR